MSWPLRPPHYGKAPETRESFINPGDKPRSPETWKRFLDTYEGYLMERAYYDFKPLYPDVAEEVYHDLVARLLTNPTLIRRTPTVKFRSVLIKLYRCMLIDTWREKGVHENYVNYMQSGGAEEGKDSDLTSELGVSVHDFVCECLSEESAEELQELYGISPRDVAIWECHVLEGLDETAAGDAELEDAVLRGLRLRTPGGRDHPRQHADCRRLRRRRQYGEYNEE